MKKLVFWIILLVVLVALVGVYGYSTFDRNVNGNVHPVVSIELENYGTVKFELYPEYAPNTVKNFIKLAESGYYNNKVIYGKDSICLYLGRDENGEAVDPTTEDIKYAAVTPYNYSIDGEFIANGFDQNTLRHEKGVLSLIRNNYPSELSLTTESYNSGNAQVGIMMSDDAVNLNGVYAAFGRVVEGMDVLDKIYNEAEIKVEDAEKTDEEAANTNTEETTDTATEEAETVEVEEDDGEIKNFANYPKITEVRVDTHGINFGMPEIHEMFDYEKYINDYLSSTYNN